MSDDAPDDDLDQLQFDTAVIVVDMQNDFCHPDGVLYADASEAVIPRVNDVVEQFGDDAAIIYTQDSHTADSDEFEQWGEHCRIGSWGHELHEDIVIPESDDTFAVAIQKHTYDAFFGTNIDAMLTGFGVDRVILCGTLVNVCVQETASSASLRGYDVTVVEDAVGCLNEEQKQAALDHIDFLIGDVRSTDEI